MQKLASVLAVTAWMVAAGSQAQTLPAPQLQSDVAGVIGNTLKPTGPVTIAAPDAVVAAGAAGKRAVLLSVPVAFARTAQLTADLHATTGEKWGWDNDVVMPAGTVLYHSTFRRVATVATPMDAWCGTHAYVWGINHDRTGNAEVCITKTADGKGMIFYEAQTSEYGLRGGYYPAKPRWFAFALSGGHTQSFDYPDIREAELPSPPMTLTLKIGAAEIDKATGALVADAFWTLSGPTDSDQTASPVWYQTASVVGHHVRMNVGGHTVSFDYGPDGKSISHVGIEDGVDAAAAAPVGPMFYWTSFMVASATPPAPSNVEDTPWQFGAEHVNPDQVIVSSGSLKKGDVLLTVPGKLGPRYRLKTALAAMRTFPAVTEGSAVYAASETSRSPEGTLYRNDYWCIVAVGAQCVPASPLGVPGGQGRRAWPLTPHTLDIYEGFFVTPRTSPRYNTGYRPVDLASDPDPAPTNDTVQMRVDDVQDGYVGIKLGLQNGDKFIGAREYTLPFDAAGVARLHLWNKAIVLHRDGKTVSAALTDDASGEGPQLDPDHVFEQP